MIKSTINFNRPVIVDGKQMSIPEAIALDDRTEWAQKKSYHFNIPISMKRCDVGNWKHTPLVAFSREIISSARMLIHP